MAGDWIKMRSNLRDEPEVIRLSQIMGAEEDLVVGKLHKLWSWADAHTADGFAIGINMIWVDRYLGAGWGDAIMVVGWLAISDEGIQFPGFSKHMGTSAKSRAENTFRQRLSRKQRDEGATGVARSLIPRPFVRHVKERDGNICVYCGSTETHHQKLSVDHVMPSSRGGKSSVDNLVTSCAKCNNEKNDRTPIEWLGLDEVEKIVAHLSREVCDNFVTKTLPEKRREEKIYKNTNSPSILEVVQAGRGKHSEDECQRFHKYHTAHGWNRLADWQAALEVWEARNARGKKEKPEVKNAFANFGASNGTQ